MNLIIGQPLQMAMIEYLTKQPYKDVAGVIQQMQRLQPAPAVMKAENPVVENGKEAEGADKKTAEA